MKTKILRINFNLNLNYNNTKETKIRKSKITIHTTISIFLATTQEAIPSTKSQLKINKKMRKEKANSGMHKVK
jgi:hypothetical protein